jgi:hypothetical protein
MAERSLTPFNSEGNPREPAFWMREIREAWEETGQRWSREQYERRLDQGKWLAAYARYGGKSTACAASGVTLGRETKWRTEDPIFSTLVPEAKQAFADLLIKEGTRRANGVSITVRNKAGEPVDTEMKYSDPLLIHMLKGMDQERRWAPRVETGVQSEDAWRQDFMRLKDDPELLAALDRIADGLTADRKPSAN